VLVKQSRGYGLRNVHMRLQVQYGAEYGVGIASELGRWTRVSVTIPGNALYSNAR
jgi:two-component system sensor histidine kinase YesM